MFRFSNFGSATLQAGITASATSLQVSPGSGSLFPALTPPDTFQAVILDTSGLFEIVTCTARSGDTLTIARGREGSTPRAWAAGSLIELRLTAEVMGSFLQRSGGVMQGDLDMGGFKLLNAQLATISQFDFVKVNFVRPFNGATTYQLGWMKGGRPTIGGPDADDASYIVTRRELSKIVFFYSGVAPIPSPWVLCNGQNGTPNLLDRFLIMAGTRYPAGSKSNAALAAGGTLTTAAGGAVAPGTTGSTVLTVAQIPAHTHKIANRKTSGNNTGSFSAGTDGTAIADLETTSTGGGQGHTHTLPAQPAHTHTVALPAYYALAPVMYNPNLL